MVPEIRKRLFQVRKNRGEFTGEKAFQMWLGKMGQVLGGREREIPESRNTQAEGEKHTLKEGMESGLVSA